MPIKQRATTGLLFAVIILILSFDTFAATETINYSYDGMLRLMGVEYGDGTTVDYGYDALGNRLAKTTTLSGSPANNPPNTPSNPSPSDTAVDIDTDANLNWIGDDPDSDNVLFYDIYFGESSPPPLVKSGNSSTMYNAAGLNSIYT